MDETLRYPRTPHLEGSCLQLGDSKQRVLLKLLKGAFFIIEEKLDGANVAIRFNPQGKMILQSRGHVLTGGGREEQFDLFKSWAASHHDELWGLLKDRFVMYGEFMRATHSAHYDQLDHYFFEFDVLDLKKQQFLTTADRHDLLMGGSFPSVPLVYSGVTPAKVAVLDALVRPSLYKSEHWLDHLKAEALKAGEKDVDALIKKIDNTPLSEGLYIKLENLIETIGRAKFVRSGFVQSMQSHEEHWMDRILVPNGLSALGLEQMNGYNPHPSRALNVSPQYLRDQAAKATFTDAEQFWAIAAGAAKKKAKRIM